jgi:flagellar biosynthesis anti-sigma factor FlgM
LVKEFLCLADTSVYHIDNFKELGMAIEIKNGTGISIPFTTQPKNSINAEKTDSTFTLPEIRIEERRAVERSDSVVITSVVTQFRQSFESSSSELNTNIERLMAIKASIEDGTYKINPDRIAMKMMQYAI